MAVWIDPAARQPANPRERPMHGIIYLVGLVVIVLAILSLFGLR
jgi:hypothetical protein